MSNEELKKKIVGIIRTADTSIVIGTNNINIIADALIAAGIGDVKETEAEANRYEMLYKLQNRDMALAERRAHDAEHRAARAERALDLCETAYILSLNHRATEGISGQAIASDFGIHKFFMKQAEKELAEGNGGKKEV